MKHRAVVLVLFLVLFVVIAVACGDDDPPAGESCQIDGLVNPSTIPAVDVLLVIDESADMAPHQARLAANLRRFASVFESIEGGLPSLHVAVVSADSAGGGAFLGVPAGVGCAGPDGAFLSNERAPWWTCGEDRAARCGAANYQGTLADALECVGARGADGAGIHQPLEAMRAALAPANPNRADFLRADAVLAVYFIAATDDASTDAVSQYADSLRAAKADVDAIVVGVVGADVAGDSALPRLTALLGAFPGRAATADIAGDDWSDVMTLLAELFRRTLGFACLDEAVDATDLDPAEPGLQLDCIAAEDRALQEPIPRCAMASETRPDPTTPLPCWWVDDTDDSGCALQPFVERADFDLRFPELRCAAVCMLP